jgi:hypothetical protein
VIYYDPWFIFQLIPKGTSRKECIETSTKAQHAEDKVEVAKPVFKGSSADLRVLPMEPGKTLDDRSLPILANHTPHTHTHK